MSRKSNLSKVFLVTTSFVSGLAAGLLLAPKSGQKSRAWISDHANELSGWMDKQRKTATEKSNRELQRLRKNVHDGIQRNIPNLYEATEKIDLSDKDVHIQ
jgi:gas vesicle protein